MGQVLQKLLSVFYTRKLDLVLVGLENSGKTTLLNALASGYDVDTVPTVGMNVKSIKKGRVKMKIWDLGGQSQYRSEWSRYIKGCDCMLFLVDSFDIKRIPEAKKELHTLLENPELEKTPLLVVSNKIDLEPHYTKPELVTELNLDYITEAHWTVTEISALKRTNITEVIMWLTKQSKE
eukprot:TRINITY_DN852_c0_g1_i1.p1 TRINITY_DN852_c0_g1~~TRINITY_DN852_c0_g1_i1.p1  ORF type:complete len:179 (+),score=34.16 TRINITY_DN852_c0_g1_i1:243-779(+)